MSARSIKIVCLVLSLSTAALADPPANMPTLARFRATFNANIKRLFKSHPTLIDALRCPAFEDRGRGGDSNSPVQFVAKLTDGIAIAAYSDGHTAQPITRYQLVVDRDYLIEATGGDEDYGLEISVRWTLAFLQALLPDSELSFHRTGKAGFVLWKLTAPGSELDAYGVHWQDEWVGSTRVFDAMLLSAYKPAKPQ